MNQDRKMVNQDENMLNENRNMLNEMFKQNDVVSLII